jgi:hypothetical protein
MWRALPVHPKMAVLFFQGVVAQEALLQAFGLYQGLPLMDRERIAPLLTFLLGAVTEDATDPRIMLNQSGWCHKDRGETEAFRAWYYELLAHRAPIHASPPFAEPPEIPALGDLSLDALPDFWTKIRGMHGCNLCLRAFVEGYIVDCPKASPWEYRFLLTTEMLTTIRNLSFSGDDPDKWWQSRMKGMSIWSLAPQNESVHGKAIEQHQCMIDYEDTADNHCPRDQANSAKLTKPDLNAPTDRMSLFKWVDHTIILLTIFFGLECPLVKEFKILAELLQDPENVHNYTLINWAALTRKAHVDT